MRNSAGERDAVWCAIIVVEGSNVKEASSSGDAPFSVDPRIGQALSQESMGLAFITPKLGSAQQK